MRPLLAALFLAACGTVDPLVASAPDSGIHPCACQSALECRGDEVCPNGRVCDPEALRCIPPDVADAGGRDAGSPETGPSGDAGGGDASDGATEAGTGADGAVAAAIDAEAGDAGPADVGVRVSYQYVVTMDGRGAGLPNDVTNDGGALGVPEAGLTVSLFAVSSTPCALRVFRSAGVWTTGPEYGPCDAYGSRFLRLGHPVVTITRPGPTEIVNVSLGWTVVGPTYNGTATTVVRMTTGTL